MKRKSIFLIVIAFLLLMISIGLFIGGFYFRSLSKSQNILKNTIQSIHELTTTYINPLDKPFISDTFTINSQLQFHLDSEYYQNNVENIESQQKYAIIRNLNELNTNFVWMQDKDKKSLYMALSEKIKEEELLSTKFLIEDSTEYYFVNQILKNYINNGSCNYFESINEENTTKDNIIYLQQFMIESFIKNLKEEDFKTYEVTQMIGNEKKAVHQVSIRFTNTYIHHVLEEVLQDLKKDSRAHEILTNVYRDFDKLSINEEITFMDKKDAYILNIYTTKFLYKPLKYELIHIDNVLKESYVYENKNFYYIKNDTLMYKMNMIQKKNLVLLEIKDSLENEIGELRLEKEKNNLKIHYSFQNEETHHDFSYSSDYINVKPNKNYDNERKLSFKILKNKTNILSGEIKLTTKVLNSAAILEDTSETTLSSKMTEEEKNKIRNLSTNIKQRLEFYQG